MWVVGTYVVTRERKKGDKLRILGRKAERLKGSKKKSEERNRTSLTEGPPGIQVNRWKNYRRRRGDSLLGFSCIKREKGKGKLNCEKINNQTEGRGLAL